MPSCKGCGAPVIWVQSVTGKPMILDAKPEKRAVRIGRAGETCKIVDTYTPHWATCPEAERFRKGRRGVRKRVTRHTCDVCGRQEETDGPQLPESWKQMRLPMLRVLKRKNQKRYEVRAVDVCRYCDNAIVSLIQQREGTQSKVTP